VVPLLDVVVLGRNDDCDVVFEDRLVSRRHAEIRPALGGHLLTDLMSSNGTLVGGVRVMHHLLRDGDAIRIGEEELRYESPDGGPLP
jgi:pSer/pThr/pTyr-binding forkhead associated (FHA) protein